MEENSPALYSPYRRLEYNISNDHSFCFSAIDTKDISVNISEEIQKILKTLVNGEVIPDIPEQLLAGSGKKSGAKNRPQSPIKDKEDSTL